MKKFILFLLAIFITPIFAGAFDFNLDKAEQNKLAQELNNIKEDTCNLYDLVEGELLSYYDKNNIKDFYDPEHKTGWFRVYDFLTWLRENEKELKEKAERETYLYHYYNHHIFLNNSLNKYCALKTAETRGFLGTFLGREYLLSRYSAKIQLSKYLVTIEAGEAAYSLHTPVKLRIPKVQNVLPENFPEEINLQIFPTIVYNKDKKVSLVNFINSSIHEAMHLIGIFTSEYQEALPEFFTIYAQMAYALPLKLDEDFSSGVRSLYNTQKYFPQESEYQDALYVYIQFKKINEMKLKDIFAFSKKGPAVGVVDLSDGETGYDQASNFFLGLFRGESGEFYKLDKKLEEIKQDSSYQIIYEDEEELFVKRESSVKIYTKMPEYNYISEMILSPVNLDEYIDKNPSIFPEYKQSFKKLAQAYIDIVNNAIYKEYDWQKYTDIEHHPLKYVLKENKDVPPTPEGYI